MIDNSLDGQMRVTVIATGFDAPEKESKKETKAEKLAQEEKKVPVPDHAGERTYKHLKSLASSIREENPEEFPPMAVNFDIPTFLRKHAD